MKSLTYCKILTFLRENAMKLFSYNTNRLFVYIVLVIVFYLSFMFLRFSLQIQGYNGGYFRWLFDSLLFASPVLFCKRRCLIYLYLLLVNFYFLSIIWYYHTCGTIMPLSSYLMFYNLKGLGASIFHSIHISDILLFLPSICFVIFFINI